MNWYCVKVLYCARVSQPPMEGKLDNHWHDDDFYEESVMLVQAETPQRAAEWVTDTCKKNDNRYVNRYGQVVDYQFYDWLEVDEIKSATLRNGTVAMSATYRMPKGTDVEELIDRRFTPCDRGELFPLHAMDI